METTTKHSKAKRLRGWLGATKTNTPPFIGGVPSKSDESLYVTGTPGVYLSGVEELGPLKGPHPERDRVLSLTRTLTSICFFIYFQYSDRLPLKPTREKSYNIFLRTWKLAMIPSPFVWLEEKSTSIGTMKEIPLEQTIRRVRTPVGLLTS